MDPTTYSLTYSLSLTHSLALTHSLTYSLSLTQPLTHPTTNSLPHSHAYRSIGVVYHKLVSVVLASYL